MSKVMVYPKCLTYFFWQCVTIAANGQETESVITRRIPICIRPETANDLALFFRKKS